MLKLSLIWTKYQYLITFFFSLVFFVSFVATLVFFFENKIPAPHLSPSESFNEKARWFRNLAGKRCDILVIGSSMALNNINGAYMSSLLRNKEVVNLGAFSLPISDSALLLKYTAPLCKPKLIILATYYGDFNHNSEKSKKIIEWELFQRYITGSSAEIVYLQSLDFNYYVSTFFSRKKYSIKRNTIYESLNFDETGSVVLDCEKFDIQPNRWNGYSRLTFFDKNKIRSQLDELYFVEKIANENHSRLLVVAMPLRKVAVEKLATLGVETLWEDVSKSINNSGGAFINVDNISTFEDSYFTDFAHLNGCGSKKLIDFILPTVLQLLPDWK